MLSGFMKNFSNNKTYLHIDVGILHYGRKKL